MYIIGTSSNYAGQRLSKDDALFEALGSNDELSSSLGYLSYIHTILDFTFLHFWKFWCNIDFSNRWFRKLPM